MKSACSRMAQTIFTGVVPRAMLQGSEAEAWTFANLHILVGTSCVPFWIILSNIKAQPVCEER